MTNLTAIAGLAPYLESRRSRYPGTTYTIKAITEHEGQQFVRLREDDGDSAGELLVRVTRDGSIDVLALDTVLSEFPKTLPAAVISALRPVPASNSEVVAETSAITEADWITHARASAPAYTGTGSVNAMLMHWAMAALSNMSSAHAPGTESGNLACAWAVNRIASLALQQPVGGGLSTVNMNTVLAAKHGPPQGQPVAGDIIMSPTAHRTGHVGIVGGALDVVVDDTTPIYSNSSTQAVFLDHLKLGSWRSKYVNNYGLDLHFYRLNPSVFGLETLIELRVANRDTVIRVAGQDRLLRRSTKVVLLAEGATGWSTVAVLPQHQPQGLVQSAHLSPVPTV